MYIKHMYFYISKKKKKTHKKQNQSQTLFLWTAFSFDGIHSSWDHIDELIQRHNIHFHPELH